MITLDEAENYQRLREWLLIMVYENSESTNSAFSLVDLMSTLEVEGDFDETMMRDAAHDFEAMGYFKTSETNRDLIIWLTQEGAEYAFYAKAKRDREALEDLDSDRRQNSSAPASDRIVTIDHNAPEWKEVIESVDNTLGELHRNNEIGAEEPDDKDRLEAELEAGKRLLEARSVDLRKLAAVLVKALRYISEKFTGAAIGKMAGWALDALKKLFDFAS